MIRAIPKKLLPHSATLYQAGAPSLWSNAADTSLATVANVRFEPYHRIVKTADNTDVQLSSLMFFDVRNSILTPSTVSFTVGQFIVWGSTRYMIETVEPLYDDADLHHYEIGLSMGRTA